MGLIVAVAVLGTVISAPAGLERSPSSTGRIGSYATIVVVDLGLVLYVARVGRQRSALTLLLGPRVKTLSGWAVDACVAFLGWLIIEGIEFASMRLSSSTVAVEHAALLPRSTGELALFLALALWIGFAEELVFRGYLMRQISALTSRPWLGFLGQGLLFGVAHADRGAFAATRIAAYGLILAAIAAVRGRLAPAIACHVAVDAWAGLASG